jgi:hypothetical protein
MSQTNLAHIIGGPCLIYRDGAIFRSKGDVVVDGSLETFEIVLDLYHAVDVRVAGQPIKVSFEPEGKISDLPVLFPYLGEYAIGKYITPRYECGAVVAADDTIAVAETSLPAGTPVSFGTLGTMPAGLTEATLYYLGANVSGVRKIYDNSADSIAGTADAEEEIGDAGTGKLAFIVQKTLVIIGNDGERFTFHNAAVSKMPAINFKSTATLWGGVEFECFSKNGVAWDTANSFYTIDTAAFSDTGFDPADIITQAYSFTWGSGIWAAKYTKEGITVDSNLGLEAVDDDASGVITRQISSIGFTAKCQPMGPGLSDFMTALKLQGAGATRGRSTAGPDFDIAGTGFFARLTAASLNGGAAQWSSKNNRIAELTWAATRKFESGTALPLFYIGTEAPE